ncbi:hypothetical protein IPG36_03830 [bacterium]|nr:MAG: hypothetical protein IPG36_03830 [bacterium]
MRRMRYLVVPAAIAVVFITSGCTSGNDPVPVNGTTAAAFAAEESVVPTVAAASTTEAAPIETSKVEPSTTDPAAAAAPADTTSTSSVPASSPPAAVTLTKPQLELRRVFWETHKRSINDDPGTSQDRKAAPRHYLIGIPADATACRADLQGKTHATITSDEALAKYGKGSSLVKMWYKAALSRPGDKTGITHHSRAIRDIGVVEAANRFLAESEYLNRLKAICG